MRNFQDFINEDPQSKLMDWGFTFSVISILLFCAGIFIIVNPDCLPDPWEKIKGLNYVLAVIPMAAAVYEMRLIISTWLAFEKKKKDERTKDENSKILS